MFDFGILDMSWIVTALDPGLALQIANWQNWAVFQLNHCNSSLRYSWMITQGLFTFTSTCDVTLSFNEQDLPVLTLAAYISDSGGSRELLNTGSIPQSAGKHPPSNPL